MRNQKHEKALEHTYNVKQNYEQELREVSIYQVYKEVLKLLEFGTTSVTSIEDHVVRIFSLKKEYYSITDDSNPVGDEEIRVFSLPENYYRTNWA